MKKIVIILIVLVLVVAFLAIRQRAKKEQEEFDRTQGNYVGINTPSGQYGVDVNQVASGWEQISGLFGNSSSSNSMKTPVDCSLMNAEERNAIMNSENYTCA